MKVLKPIAKKTGKTERERKVLLRLIEYYIKTGKPVGSNTLKDVGFADLSSATIRNYFAKLEEEGYLSQQHSSGGRIPTDKAYRLYAADTYHLSAEHARIALDPLRSSETREISLFLQHAAEKLSQTLQMAVFLSAPRFEQDFIIAIKIVSIDAERCLCVLMTDFGELITEILHVGIKLSSFTIKHLESYFQSRLTGQPHPYVLTKSEEDLGAKLYNELMIRYIVNHSQFEKEGVYRTGFSSLLSYPEFRDPTTLSDCLALFENTSGMRLLLKESCKFNLLKYWIGADLTPYSSNHNLNCTVIATPYHVNHQPVGAIGVLGPARISYPQVFIHLRNYAESIANTLTSSLYKFKINLRQPRHQTIDCQQLALPSIEQTRQLLLADNRLQDKSTNPHKPVHRRMK